MKRFRLLIVLFVVSLACRPTESQTVRQPRQERAPIPPSVSAARRTPVVVVAHDVLPAVVNIQTEATIRRREIDPFFDPFGFFGGNREYKTQSLGSGFVWSNDGIVVTNNHVVEGASSISVNFNDGSKLPAKLIGVDPDSDVAVLRVDAKGLATAPIGTSGDLMIGESVVAVGNPFGLSGTVTTGVVSALGRSVPSKEQGRTFTDFIQTDASINPGNSGGPLLDSKGEVIGINEQIASSNGSNSGVGFAIPVTSVRYSLDQLQNGGKVEYAFLGVTSESLYPQLADHLGIDTENGALISDVVSGSPADKAGLKGASGETTFQLQHIKTGGDVVIAVDGKPVFQNNDLSELIALHKPGDTVKLDVIRDGNQHATVDVTLGSRPADVNQ